MAIEIPNALLVACKAVAGVSPTIVGSGIGAITRNGAGDYSIALSPKIDPARCAINVTARGTTPTITCADIASGGASMTVKSADAAGAAADTNFDVVIIAIP